MVSVTLLTATHVPQTASAPQFLPLASPPSATKSLWSVVPAMTRATALFLAPLASAVPATRPTEASVRPTASAQTQPKPASTKDAETSRPSEASVISTTPLLTAPCLALHALPTRASHPTMDPATRTETVALVDKRASAVSARLFQAQTDLVMIPETAPALLPVPLVLVFSQLERPALPTSSAAVQARRASLASAEPFQAQRDLATLLMIVQLLVLLVLPTSVFLPPTDSAPPTISVVLVRRASTVSASPSQDLWEAVTTTTMVIAPLPNQLADQACAIRLLVRPACPTLSATLLSHASLQSASQSRAQELLATTVTTVSSLGHLVLPTHVSRLPTDSAQPTISAVLARLVSMVSASPNQLLEVTAMILLIVKSLDRPAAPTSATHQMGQLVP